MNAFADTIVEDFFSISSSHIFLVIVLRVNIAILNITVTKNKHSQNWKPSR